MKKKTISHRTTKPVFSQSKKLLHKPQTILGIVILVIVLCVSLITVFKAVTTDVRSIEFAKAPSAPIPAMSGVVLESLPAATAQATISATQHSQTATILPATPSATPQPIRIRVKKDQTFWELAKQYCGSYTFAEKLARYNGYKRVTDLKEGDWIVISCK